ncbi:OsmC family peroxiredoxin [Epidermidibacterium keratini]|uniref:OsmC family peroxiredoxin n=1 Tax=Epidermidibacterium keratini TaxID=1891644 RepID=A0A7L4YQM1_9ACTN|nr:OsmC family protein [Epidermidibacterium keratini]QHC01089.1 OsmC family peroxiredoxin [Epidermidibacterium keratini]
MARRTVQIEKIAPSKFVATNERGAQITIGMGEDADFVPGELLLAAIGSCSGIDVDILTSRRGESTTFRIEVGGEKVRDEHGNHMTDLEVTFEVKFDEGEAGDAAREVLPKAVERSRTSLCTVGRTIELGTPIKDVLL